MTYDEYIKNNPGIDWNNPVNGLELWKAAQIIGAKAEREACVNACEPNRSTKDHHFDGLQDAQRIIRARLDA